ncbi:hypothetical protein I79_003911 [Cricetulus griseus]|uniref:Uncharacterized protein n=1 Tax=Cricetulus griseus TaxID=10029 RepID=G3H187_CRIGR|nr:hypothetical protein I79_003911 [Cricetulus griseus]
MAWYICPAVNLQVTLPVAFRLLQEDHVRQLPSLLCKGVLCGSASGQPRPPHLCPEYASGAGGSGQGSGLASRGQALPIDYFSE